MNQARPFIAGGLRTFKPDMAEFSKEKDRLYHTVVGRKEQAIYEAWIGDLRTHAKVSINKAISAPSADEGAPSPTSGGVPIED